MGTIESHSRKREMASIIKRLLRRNAYDGEDSDHGTQQQWRCEGLQVRGAGGGDRVRRAHGRCAPGFDRCSRAVLVLVSPGASQAVRNEGDANLWLVAISSETYDPAESVARKVV